MHTSANGFNDDDEEDSMRSAQRSAVAAAAAVDPTGQALRRWSLAGEGAAAKLMRLEERLSQMAAKGFVMNGAGGKPVNPPPAENGPAGSVHEILNRRLSMRPDIAEIEEAQGIAMRETRDYAAFDNNRSNVGQALKFRPRYEELVRENIVKNDRFQSNF